MLQIEEKNPPFFLKRDTYVQQIVELELEFGLSSQSEADPLKRSQKSGRPASRKRLAQRNHLTKCEAKRGATGILWREPSLYLRSFTPREGSLSYSAAVTITTFTSLIRVIVELISKFRTERKRDGLIPIAQWPQSSFPRHPRLPVTSCYFAPSAITDSVMIYFFLPI